MAFQSCPETVQANIRYTIAGTPAENVLNFKKAGGYVQADLDALASAIDQWASDELMPLLASSTVYKETYCKGLENVVDLQRTDDTNAGATGTVGGGEASNVAKAVTLGSGFTGRNSRGRIFIGGISTADGPDANHVSQGFVDDLLAALEALKTIVEALDFIWVVVSRFIAGVKRVTAVTYPMIQLKVSNLTTDSMRGRLPKT